MTAHISSSRKALGLATLVGLFGGAALAAIPRPANALLAAPAGKYACATPSSCGAGRYNCDVNCGDYGCSCSIR